MRSKTGTRKGLAEDDTSVDCTRERRPALAPVSVLKDTALAAVIVLKDTALAAVIVLKDTALAPLLATRGALLASSRR
jgi:hypothetical protein